MANVYEGFVSGKGLKFGIVVARFNEFITSKLLGGALDTLHRHETNDDDIDVAWVPGAFELPIVAKKMAESGKYDAVICLGAVIRGSTTHYDYVCNEASKGIAQVGSVVTQLDSATQQNAALVEQSAAAAEALQQQAAQLATAVSVFTLDGDGQARMPARTASTPPRTATARPLPAASSCRRRAKFRAHGSQRRD